MGRKNSASASENDSSCEEENEEEIEEQVIKAIKELPSLEEKVQAIALNGYLIQKRELDKKMETETSAKEWEFREKYRTQVEQIQKIIEGSYVFTDSDYQEAGELLTEEELGVKNNYFTNEPVSEYWLKVLMSSDVVGPTITQKDEPVLRHLQKITVDSNQEGTSLSATFHFSENEWFTNKTIKKEFEIEGQDINKSFGDQIEWKQGKNITIKIVKKKNKKKKQTKTKTVREESFFNFFRDIDLSGDSDEQEDHANQEEETEVEQLEQQYEIANHLYEDIVPRSLEYYLGVVGGGFGNLADFGDLQAIQEADEDEEAPKKKNKKKRKASNDSGN